MVVDTITLCIDWGFTRLKVWVLDQNLSLIKDYSYYNAEVVANPVFYDDEAISSVRSILKACLQEWAGYSQSIYLSSQMHCLSGIMANDKSFLSTWNDHPKRDISIAKVHALNGIPLLHSMPVHKLVVSPRLIGIATEGSIQSSDYSGLLASLSSPLTLVLSALFESPLPCSPSWWQSTCISNKYYSQSLSSSTFLADLPLQISGGSSKYLLSSSSRVLVYPEVGDLQASSFAALQDSDIVINLGTGSQVIFSPKLSSTLYPFYRSWPVPHPACTAISHIPCGRLLSSYAAAKGFNLLELLDFLRHLNTSTLRHLVSVNSGSILFFPGYCAYANSYYHLPRVSIEDLILLEPDALLSLWIHQYYSVVCNALGQYRFAGERKASIAVTGALGGFAPYLITLLAEMLAPKAFIHDSDSPLYSSLTKIYGNAPMAEPLRVV
jgi:hypothetical protein